MNKTSPNPLTLVRVLSSMLLQPQALKCQCCTRALVDYDDLI